MTDRFNNNLNGSGTGSNGNGGSNPGNLSNEELQRRAQAALAQRQAQQRAAQNGVNNNLQPTPAKSQFSNTNQSSSAAGPQPTPPNKPRSPRPKPSGNFFARMWDTIVRFFKATWSFKRVVKVFFTSLALLFLAGMALFFTFAAFAPRITQAELASESTTQILDSKGKVIWNMNQEDRAMAKETEIPQALKDAVVSVEDRRFYKHHGIDPIRILGATFANITGSSLGLQGGSTLTQQLVKLSVFSTARSDQTLRRKAQEAWLAMKVERNFSKNQILTFYINKVYEGNGVYGMKTAAQFYYDKKLKDLTLSETALVVGIPNAPASYDPYRNPALAKARRAVVLDAMVANHKISKAEADEAKAVPIETGLIPLDQHDAKVSKKSVVADGYVNSTLKQVRALGYEPEKNAIKIYTNLNSKLQNRLYDVANGNGGVVFPSDELQLGMTLMDPKTGRVLAQIGGRNLTAPGGLNRAVQTTRSAGSTAKPIVDYGPAIEYFGWGTGHHVKDTPYKYEGTDIEVNNWDHKYQGDITMRKALAQSRNIPAIRTFMKVGSNRASAFLKGLGIKISANKMVGSNAIGIDISTEQEAAAYAAISNGGTYYKPLYVDHIVTADGNSRAYTSRGKRAMKKTTAFMLVSMMKDVLKPDATAPAAAISGIYQAGKSGLVAYSDSANVPDQAIMDTWFTGFTRSLVLSVWMGYDEPIKPGHYIPYSQQDISAQVYRAVMTYAVKGYPNRNWKMPAGVAPVLVNGVKEYELKNGVYDDIPESAPSESSSTISSSSSAPVDSSSTSSLSSGPIIPNESSNNGTSNNSPVPVYTP